MAFSLLVFLVTAQMYPHLSVYAKGFVELSELEAGMLFAINGTMVVVAQYIVTRLTDRLRLTTSMGLGVALYALGFGLVVFSHSFLMLGLCVFIITLGELTYMPPSSTLTVNLSSGVVSGLFRPDEHARVRRRAPNRRDAAGPFALCCDVAHHRRIEDGMCSRSRIPEIADT